MKTGEKNERKKKKIKKGKPKPTKQTNKTKQKKKPKIQEQLSYGKITSGYLESAWIWVYSLTLEMGKSMMLKKNKYKYQ